MAQEQPDSSEGAISANDLEQLTALYVQFEGAADPLSIETREAKNEFHTRLESIYESKIKPRFLEVDFTGFLRLVRTQCRQRARCKSPEFPSI